ncbi:Pyocin repressor protein [Hartmannibacter diazotrophicus]|uniref:Pyocin repressor protein n=1 Tax=Hartmannibacter diazotrophicus TaxID=1482074 RepID=A0A2C9D6H6_9HYPH|nr:Pyocin repressor protein [Hartmannibacter diazotrophicus]
MVPNAEHLLLLSELGCDPTWLVTGKEAQAAPIGPVAPIASEPAIVTLPHYVMALSAGKGIPEPDFPAREGIQLPEQWVRSVTGRNPRNLIVAHASGESMEPTIADGDLLIIDRTATKPLHGKIFALSVDGDLLVKRIARRLDGSIHMISDNPNKVAYPDEELADTMDLQIHVLGQVVWHGGALA